ncbi:hypothetical protein DEU56DRAFT_324348 [Suillus clintonianus]|uniref:uncharacterized protein n=1 Tax=Suillus clintonianus TaxID=1904413 RepID=UPI001B862BE9|nr:uncharacterized protein DEU56DRAFT_324348 [Suillus clintonianus]KAG2139245.1 hypothetical protein DEU56DRAFT_324348 [Suillus clintonianus]
MIPAPPCTMLATTGGPALHYSFQMSLRLHSRSLLNGTLRIHYVLPPMPVTPLIPVSGYCCSTCVSLSQPLQDHHPLHPQYDTYPRANSGVQDIACPLESQRRDIFDSCMHNGGTRQNPSLQGAFETAVRFNCPLSTFLDDQAGRTEDSMPLINKDTQIAYPLAAPCLALVYDLRYSYTSLQFRRFPRNAGLGYGHLRFIPLTPARPKQIRLISKDFPWAFDIEPSPKEEYITCLTVITALYNALQLPLEDTEWGAAGEDKRARIIEARNRRLTIAMVAASRESLNSGASPTAKPRVRSAPDLGVELAIQGSEIIRVDWLGPRVAFAGLEKDEEFARRRLIPGASEPPETWVVSFRDPYYNL